MERLQQSEALANRREVRRQFIGDAKWMKSPDAMPIFQQIFVADRKQRPAQGCKYRQLVFRPLDSCKRRSQGLDLGAVMKRPAADQQMRDTARFEGFDVRPRHVFLVAGEAAEQETDMSRLNRHEM